MIKTKNTYDIAIIGAGISGTLIANNTVNKKVILLEKSKGLGGRVASRRLGGHIFDHGARQVKVEHRFIKELVTLGLKNNLLKEESQIFKANQGINQWIKYLLRNNEVHKECLVSKIYKNNKGTIELRDENNHIQAIANNVVITAPANQAKQILENSNYETSFLNKASYSKNIQYLVIVKNIIKENSLVWNYFNCYQETMLTEGFSYHLELREPYISGLFEQEKEDIITHFQYILQSNNIDITESHLHKWRYSQVITTVPDKYQSIFARDNIYLAGDYFYGNDLNAAAQSVENILHYLQ
jgi:predicted NAD/FAD-dependent oxidoreductase